MTYQGYPSDLDRGTDSGGGFIIGLLSGVVLGVGVGLLFAPRAGSELRETLSQSANDIQRAATDSFNQVSSKVRETTQKGREVLNRTRESWGEMRQESQAGYTPPSPSTGSGSYVS
jgi:gas vesicle protein